MCWNMVQYRIPTVTVAVGPVQQCLCNQIMFAWLVNVVPAKDSFGASVCLRHSHSAIPICPASILACLNLVQHRLSGVQTARNKIAACMMHQIETAALPRPRPPTCCPPSCPPILLPPLLALSPLPPPFGNHCSPNCLQHLASAVLGEVSVSAMSASMATLAAQARNPTLSITLLGCIQQQQLSQQTLGLLPPGVPPEKEP